MDDRLILVRVAPMDREWASRAIRATLGANCLDEQRRIMHLIWAGVRGYTAPMTARQADAIANMIYAARDRGGKRWQAAMERLSAQFRTERVAAVKVQTGARWIPVELADRAIRPRKRRCPACGNPAAPIVIGKATDWMCVNCDKAVIPEEEA